MADRDAAFVFADIAGFTALTEAHGDEQAVALVDGFTAAVEQELPAGATRVKSIGDAVMLRVPDPGDAILLGLRMTRDVLREHLAFAVRVGLHHGPAVERDGVVQPNAAPRFSRTPAAVQGPPAKPGAHAAEVLADWGAEPKPT